jgi:dihydroflavonol-4-reductase
VRGRGETGCPVLVTGASGFIGRHLVRALCRQRRKVIALVRRVDSLASLQKPFVQVVTGDIQDPGAYVPYLKEGLTVFHLAAARRIPGASSDWFKQINEMASHRLALACAESGVSKFIHVSTAVVFGPSSGEPLVESNSLAPESLDDFYIQTKAQALVQLRKLIDRGLHLVTVCPAIVFGPDEPTHPNGVTSQMRRLLRTRASVVVGDGAKMRTLVHVDDVVHGLLLAEDRAPCGEAFILGGGDCSPRQFNQMVFDSAGIKPRCSVSIPAGMALTAARLADRLLLRRPGSGFETGIRNLMLEWRYSSKKAMEILGFVPTPLPQAIQKTLLSFESEDS